MCLLVSFSTSTPQDFATTHQTLQLPSVSCYLNQLLPNLQLFLLLFVLYPESMRLLQLLQL